MRASVRCADKYEAQKLAGLIYVRDPGEANVRAILNVIGSEMVIQLRDGSAHSVVMSDPANVEVFADFCQSVFDGEHRMGPPAARGDVVDISKS